MWFDIKYFLLIACMIVCYSSCTAPIELKTAHSDPVIVIYGCLTEDTIHQSIRISVSSPYFEMQPNLPVSNAIVSIQSSEGRTFELVESTTKGVYLTKYPMAAITGATYLLNVRADINQNGNLKLYEATATMQRPFVVDSVNMNIMYIMGFKHYTLNLYAQEEEGTDYYCAYYILNDTLSASKISSLIVFSDFGIDGHYIDGTPLMQFEDKENERFGGSNRRDTLRYVKPGDKITFCISLIEKGYCDFIQQSQQERRGENPFFGGPASNIATNISNGGVGYFAAFSTTRLDVFVP